MATFRDVAGYFRDYKTTAILSIAASSLFEIIDLIVPYAIGQILNVLSDQPLDVGLQWAIATLSSFLNWGNTRGLAIAILLAIVFVVTVVRAPIQPWIASWFHWDIALRTRRDHTQRTIEKILSLPLEYYDENNPGRIAGRVGKGISNYTWTYPEVAGQFIPKLFRVLGIFVVIGLIEWRIAVLFLISFAIILTFSMRDLQRIIKKKKRSTATLKTPKVARPKLSRISKP
jgi:ATP-binding cassette subfamily B protein